MSYKIRYTIECGEFDKTDHAPNQGLTDAILMASIIKGSDGSTDTLWIGRNETGVKLSPFEMFVQWGVLAKHLTDILPETSLQYGICEVVVDAIRKLVSEKQ